MSDNAIDPERLAAMLDGTSSASERDALLRALAQSPEELDAYADAAAALEGLNEPVAERADLPSRQSVPSRRWRNWGGLAAAALVVTAGAVMLRQGSGGDADPARRLIESELALPTQWSSQTWGSARGIGASVTPDVRAARAGVLYADLIMASRDGTRADSIANTLAALIDDVPGSAATVSILHSWSTGSASSQDRATTLQASLASLVSRERFTEAVWLESARVAALAHDAEYLKTAMPTSVDLALRAIIDGLNDRAQQGVWQQIASAVEQRLLAVTQ